MSDESIGGSSAQPLDIFISAFCAYKTHGITSSTLYINVENDFIIFDFK
jgi:hypothetical protein